MMQLMVALLIGLLIVAVGTLATEVITLKKDVAALKASTAGLLSLPIVGAPLPGPHGNCLLTNPPKCYP